MASMRLYHVIQAAVIVGLVIGSLGGKNMRGCTAPFLLPDKPFLVVWNHPTSGCAAKGVHLDFEKWGIVDNSNDSFVGEQIALLYSLGQFPLFSGNTPVNGGIPQLGNLTSHLLKTTNDINAHVGSPSFSGLGVVDFEAWRPILWLNFDSLKIYEEKSVELAKERFPSYNGSQLFEEATKEFNAAARTFMETTLKTVLLLRPNGSWGFYGYPRCWDSYCNASTVEINDKMSWVYNSSSGLYPSIYFDNSLPASETARRVQGIIHETLRVRALWSRQDTAILPYSLIQENAYNFFSLSDLSNSIREPADMGSAGVVLWGSSSYMQAKNECVALRDYLNSTLGPLSLQVTNFFANCSQQLCHGHGRCVSKHYEKYSQHYIQKSGRRECSLPASSLTSKKRPAHKSMDRGTRQSEEDTFTIKNDKFPLSVSSKWLEFAPGFNESPLDDFDDYICRCLAGWSGPHCEQQ